MPSKSPAQARLFAGVAHNPKFAAKVGIPKKIGIEFNKADSGTGILRKAAMNKKPPTHSLAPKMASGAITVKPTAPKIHINGPMGDNRKGRLHPVDTDRGEFRFKDNRAGGD